MTQSALLSKELQSFIHQLRQKRKKMAFEEVCSVLLDHAQYQISNADSNGFDGSLLEHFILHGHRREKYFRPGRTPCNISTPVAPIALYLSSSPRLTDGTFLYRTKFRAMRDERKALHCTTTGEFKSLLLSIFSASEIVFSRPNENDFIAIYLIRLARKIGVKVILDYDDLVLPEYFANSGLGRTRKTVKANIDNSRVLAMRSAFLSQCDEIHCSTKAIQDRLAHLRKPIKLICNKLPAAYAAKVNEFHERLSSVCSRKLRFLYMSGTATHGKDFQVCQGAVAKLAQSYGQHFSFTFLGQVQEGVRQILDFYHVDVKHVPRSSFAKMHQLIAQHDVCLAPLEQTPFNDCKSNIKFIESGIHGVPLVCSPCYEFKLAINHGVNGWICNDPSDWHRQLRQIVCGESKIIPVSLCAYKTSIQNYTF